MPANWPHSSIGMTLRASAALVRASLAGDYEEILAGLS
jgi:hypothetical protein